MTADPTPTPEARPEQEEAVRLLREGNPGNNAQGDSICWCACGCVQRRPPHWDRCTRCSQGEHLATPPPVPTALDVLENQLRAWHDSNEPARSFAERILTRLGTEKKDSHE